MTEAITTPVGSTASVDAGSAIGSSLTKIFSDPNVQTGVGTAVGSIITAGLGAIGVNTGKTPDQIAAEQAAAAAAAKAKQTQMLVIGGAVAVVVVIVVVVILRRG